MIRIIPCDPMKIRATRSDNWTVLNEFAESDHKCIKIENYTQASARVCTSSFNGSIKRYGFNMKAVTQDDNVYIIKNLYL